VQEDGGGRGDVLLDGGGGLAVERMWRGQSILEKMLSQMLLVLSQMLLVLSQMLLVLSQMLLVLSQMLVF
jgi:hypothetical protein